MQTNLNLYVITGGPGTGKTTLIEALKAEGLQCIDEVARQIIKEEMAHDGEALPWKDTMRYTQLMLKRSVETYGEYASRSDISFFDRGIPDTLAYARLIGLDGIRFIQNAVHDFRYNPAVFILPPWKAIYCNDEERRQSFDKAVDTYHVLYETYIQAGYTLIELPQVSVQERVRLIMEKMKTEAFI